MSKVYYLAGPMTGVPKLNFPLFLRVAKELRAKGYDIVSPVDLVSPVHQQAILNTPEDQQVKEENVTGETLGQIIARDIEKVIDAADGIILLPGWVRSRGARLEACVGLIYGKTFFGHDGSRLYTATTEWVKERVL